MSNEIVNEEKIKDAVRFLDQFLPFASICLMNTELPFGKYSGKRISSVPLRYLDQTVSKMPESRLVRCVKRFLDSDFILDLFSLTEYLPNKPLIDMVAFDCLYYLAPDPKNSWCIWNSNVRLLGSGGIFVKSEEGFWSDVNG